jgi:uncharacterized repeat protein (TIGR03803 family)
MRVLFLCLVVLITSGIGLGQATETVLYSFGGVPNDGTHPVSSLIADGLGNLYGTAPEGGTAGQGTVFELSPQSNATWTETTLYNFCSETNCADGERPLAGLVMDAAGNLYGTTWGGGPTCPSASGRCGELFELSPPQQSGQNWTLSVIYGFCSDLQQGSCLDGYEPAAQLIFDSAGNLYGTTERGGTFGQGTAFELSPGSGGWTENVLYSFCSVGALCSDGAYPVASLTFGPSGNLYGTAQHGGRYRTGVVFQLSKNGGGWQETVLLNTSYGSVAPVSFDAAGNLYGTTPSVAFQLNRKQQAEHTRPFSDATGEDSQAGVLVDQARNVFYGTAAGGGILGGSVWEINASHELAPLYLFCSLVNCTDGQGPMAGLIEDASGNLYGTTEYGGAYGSGVVFKVTP